MEKSEHVGEGVEAAGNFPSTHWSLVSAAHRSDSPEARAALAKLCELYWYPVYVFVRRRGYAHHDAKDLTQELFARLIEKESMHNADRDKGRFRSFLVACVDHLLAKEWKKEHALKRGGQYTFVPLDEATAEARYGAEPADAMSPEKVFEHRWALALLDQAMEQLRQEHAQAGKSAQFVAFQGFLSGTTDAPGSYAEIGARLGMTEGAARQAASRLRRRFGELLRLTVAQTVASPADSEAELRHFRSVLSDPGGA